MKVIRDWLHELAYTLGWPRPPTPQQSTAPLQGANKHIFAFLDYYVDSPNSLRSAVLINGAWGIGKSFAIDAYLHNLRARGKTVIYVSLYGVSDVDDIDTMLLTGAHALSDNVAGRVGLRLAKAALKKVSFGSQAKAVALLPKTKIDLVIFDDFERSSMKPNDTLGYINTFVEHDGMRVLIVCNEKGIEEFEKYKGVREKVVGNVFDFQLDARPALAFFVGEFGDADARAFLQKHEDVALHIFQQSGTSNLRLLKQTVWAWSRLFATIDKKYRDRERGMVAAFELFVALSIELKAGRLQPEDLEDRISNIVAGQVRGENGVAVPTRISTAQNRYKTHRLHDTVLNDGVLKKVLCEGVLDATAINASLAQSEYFLKPEDEPAWQKVWHGITRDATEFNEAFKKMEEQFAARDFLHGPELLHVFGLRLWATQIGQLRRTDAEVVEEAKAYIDELYQKGTILDGYSEGDYSQPMTGAYGLSYYGKDNAGFKQLRDYYLTRCKEAVVARRPAQLNDLMDLMARDAGAFFAEIAWTNDDRKNTFYSIPIFSVSDPGAFVKRFLALHPEKQRTVLNALNGRYDSGRLANVLAGEREWLVGVRDGIKAFTDRADTPPIRRFALRNDVSRLLDPLLN